jgi:hypothetical protein
VVGLLVPTIFFRNYPAAREPHLHSGLQSESIDKISQAVAVILFLLYLLTVVYQLRAPEGKELPRSALVLVSLNSSDGALDGPSPSHGATLGIAILGEILSGVVEPFGASLA